MKSIVNMDFCLKIPHHWTLSVNFSVEGQHKKVKNEYKVHFILELEMGFIGCRYLSTRTDVEKK